jgi:site-specific recombinase XerD
MNSPTVETSVTTPLSQRELSGKLGQQINDFLEYLQIERNSSKLTIRDYRHYLARFYFWLAETKGESFPIEQVDVGTVRRYRLYLSQLTSGKDELLSLATQAYHVIALRAFLKWLTKNDLPVLSPEKIELPKSESRNLTYLDRTQLDRLLSQPGIVSAPGLRDRAIMEVLFSTGLRVSELVALNRETTNLQTREFSVVGKGRKVRVVFLSDRAVEWLERYLATRADDWPALFINYRGAKDTIEAAMKKFDKTEGAKKRLTARSVERIVEKYVRLAHLPIKITPHGLRHTFATDLLSSGADLRSVQEMLGHKNVATTQIYTHVTNKQLRDVHRQFHSGNK